MTAPKADTCPNCHRHNPNPPICTECHFDTRTIHRLRNEISQLRRKAPAIAEAITDALIECTQHPCEQGPNEFAQLVAQLRNDIARCL